MSIIISQSYHPAGRRRTSGRNRRSFTPVVSGTAAHVAPSPCDVKVMVTTSDDPPTASDGKVNYETKVARAPTTSGPTGAGTATGQA